MGSFQLAFILGNSFRFPALNFRTRAASSSSLIFGGSGPFAPLLDAGDDFDFAFGGGCDFSQVLNPLCVGEPPLDSQYALNCFQSGCFSASSKLKKIDDDYFFS